MSATKEMEMRPGFLRRSLDRARRNIEARPNHLKPERYRRVNQRDERAEV